MADRGAVLIRSVRCTHIHRERGTDTGDRRRGRRATRKQHHIVNVENGLRSTGRVLQHHAADARRAETGFREGSCHDHARVRPRAERPGPHRRRLPSLRRRGLYHRRSPRARLGLWALPAMARADSLLFVIPSDFNPQCLSGRLKSGRCR